MRAVLGIVAATALLFGLGGCLHSTEGGAATGAVAGAVVAGPVGAVVGGATGAVVGHENKPDRGH
jgi:osmotically inducible lipoprotein OsmB